jgi:hypothetical protein
MLRMEIGNAMADRHDGPQHFFWRMAMEIMILVCVIAVLSFWIWSLKQEIAELRGATRPDHPEAARSSPTTSRAGNRGTDNVQTWTID